MSEEKKQGDAAQADADAQAMDYESQYKALQADHQKVVGERDEAISQLDTLAGYVDWDKVQGINSSETQTQPETKESPGNTDTAQQLAQIDRKVDTKLMALEWRMKNPDLVEYETTLVSPALARLRRQHPRTSPEKILEMATVEVEGFIEKQQAKAAEKLSEKKKTEVNASGLDSDSTTSPTPQKGGQTPEEYLAERNARQQAQLQL